MPANRRGWSARGARSNMLLTNCRVVVHEVEAIGLVACIVEDVLLDSEGSAAFLAKRKPDFQGV